MVRCNLIATEGPFSYLKIKYGYFNGNLYIIICVYVLYINIYKFNHKFNHMKNLFELKNTIKNRFTSLKRNVSSKITNLKNGSQAQKFKENFNEAKSQPRSKRTSLALGFTTVLSIFGVTLFASTLPAVAKDIPGKGPQPSPGGAPPASKPATLPSKEIVKGVSGAAASVCAIAVSSGSFVVGAACGLIVVYGILKAQGK
jgi:hypothetical protein